MELQKIFDVVKESPLFQGLDFVDFGKLFFCLKAKVANYPKDDVLLLAGDPVPFVGLVLSGGVRIVREDAEGRAMLMDEVGAPELFAEVFACAGVQSSPVTVLAAQDSQILFIGYHKIVSSCAAACPFHTKLIENMLQLMAQKSLLLNQKIEILSKRSIRERLLCFFAFQRGAQTTFTIPYSRGELAHYLCADRSAVSTELGKMQKEGLIRFQKNCFEWLG